MVTRVIIFLIINFAALALGSLFTTDGVQSDWYRLLNIAPWTPPGWVFGFAWTFIMICFSFYVSYLWNLRQQRAKLVILYTLQLALNISWNPVFFSLHETNTALLIIVMLTILIGYMLFAYYSKIGVRSLLVAPYFIWLIIATSLNGYICLRN